MSLNPRNEARKVYDSFWKGRPFPVDPVTISELIGLDVLETTLPDTVSGALIKEAGKDPVIILHKFDHSNRKRFSCSHELGHYIDRVESSESSSEFEYVDLRGPNSSNGSDPSEVFANQFAANLLMPEEVISKLHRENKSHVEMAIFFGVSVEALKNRLKSLRLL